MAKLTENVNEILIFVRRDQGKNVRMLADPRMCCKCLQVRKISRISPEVNSLTSCDTTDAAYVGPSAA